MYIIRLIPKGIASSQEVVAILAFRKWGGHFGAKVIVGGAKQTLSAGGVKKFVAILEHFWSFSKLKGGGGNPGASPKSGGALDPLAPPTESPLPWNHCHTKDSTEKQDRRQGGEKASMGKEVLKVCDGEHGCHCEDQGWGIIGMWRPANQWHDNGSNWHDAG